jgi:YbbR domain-containing protein
MIRQVIEIVGRLLLALILAVMVWLIAVQETDPVVVDTFSAAVPIDWLDQPPDTIVYGVSTEAVHVTLQAPSSVWNSLVVEQISATLSLAAQPYGKLSLPVEAHVASPLVRVVRVEPPYVSLYLEPTYSRQVKVDLTLGGEPALGYAARSWTTTPSEVTVSGPASRVERVAAVSGLISVQDERQSVERSVRLTVRDQNNALVDGVVLSPDVVQAKATIEQLGGFRDLSVRVVITGQLASGYRIDAVEVSPRIVAVFGSARVIEGLLGYVETAPVNVENTQSDVTERVPLNLPGGVSMLDDPSVLVNIKVEAIQSGLTLQLRPLMQGMPDRWEARVSPEYVDLVLTGPLPRLLKLQPDVDVRLVIDVVKLKLNLGTHQVEPQIIVPEEIKAESVLPSTVQVTIVELEISPLLTPTLPAITSTLPVTMPALTPQP